VIDWDVMLRAGISRSDLDEAARAQLHVRTHADAGEIYLESSGDLTVVSGRSGPGG
jgi:hypothetical protein